jgi:tetrahydromethanopterin S-methyltransferase subunit B
MKGYLKVEGHSGLVKNPKTGVIININETEIKSAKKRKKKKHELEQEVQDLRSEMSEIKSLLKQLVEK